MSTTDKKRHDVRFSSNILYYSESIIDIDLGFVRFIKKNFSNMQKEYQRYSRNQIKLQEREQKEQQKRWDNFWIRIF